METESISRQQKHTDTEGGDSVLNVNARRVLTEREGTSSSVFVSERRVRLGSKTSRGQRFKGIFPKAATASGFIGTGPQHLFHAAPHKPITILDLK